MMDELVGKDIGQYKVIEKLGEGGMAIVYRAHQMGLEREVALKVLPMELTRNKVFVESFLTEARLAAQMDHPHIVTIYEVGESQGMYYMAMQYVKGLSLADMIQRYGAVPPARLLRIISHVASALDYAHQRGLIHRDVKPANILVTAKPDGEFAVLTDFGIAKAVGQASVLTRTGTLPGTPPYMAPEQARGEEVTPRTDQYALGIVVYECLTGRIPFAGDTHAVLYKHVHEPPDLSTLPLLYQGVMQKVLAKNPADRFASLTQFAQTLQGAIQGQMPTPVPFPTPPTQAPPLQKKQQLPAWIWAGAAAVVVVTLVLLYALSAHQTQGDEKSPPPALAEERTARVSPDLDHQPDQPGQATSNSITLTVTATPTPTAALPPSPTLTETPAPPTNTPTPAATPTPTPTETPTRVWIPPTPTKPTTCSIQQVAPKDQYNFITADSVTLQWTSDYQLGEKDFYRLAFYTVSGNEVAVLLVKNSSSTKPAGLPAWPDEMTGEWSPIKENDRYMWAVGVQIDENERPKLLCESGRRVFGWGLK